MATNCSALTVRNYARTFSHMDRKIVQPRHCQKLRQNFQSYGQENCSTLTVRNYARTFSQMDRKTVQPRHCQKLRQNFPLYGPENGSASTFRNYTKTVSHMDRKIVKPPLSETTPELSVIWTGKLFSLHCQKLRQNFLSYGPENGSASTVRNYAINFSHMDLKIIQPRHCQKQRHNFQGYGPEESKVGSNI